MTEWYQIDTSVKCIFALDSKSIVDNSKVYFTNDSSRFLTFHNGKKSSSINSYLGKNFYKSVKLLENYKTLYINNTNLIFDSPIPLPNRFTLILKTSVNTPSVFLSRAGQDRGPTFSKDTTNLWSIWSSSENTVDVPKIDIETNSYNSIHTLVLSGDIAARTVTFTTDFGVNNIEPFSASFDRFLKEQTYDTIGSVHNLNTDPWLPDANIIAYGLFDEVLSQEQLDILWDKVDSDFLISRIPFALKHFEMGEPPSTDFSKDIIIDTMEVIRDGESNYEPITKGFLNYKSFKVYDYRHLINNTDIKDYIYEEDIPVSVKVFLYEKNTGELIRSTISNKEGYFEFLNLDKNLSYVVRSSDKKLQYKSITKDY